MIRNKLLDKVVSLALCVCMFASIWPQSVWANEFADENVLIDSKETAADDISVSVLDIYGNQMESLCLDEYRYLHIHKNESDEIYLNKSTPQIFFTLNKVDKFAEIDSIKNDCVKAFSLPSGSYKEDSNYFKISVGETEKKYAWGNISDVYKREDNLNYDMSTNYAGAEYKSGESYYMCVRLMVNGIMQNITTSEKVMLYDTLISEDDSLTKSISPFYLQLFKWSDTLGKCILETVGNEDHLWAALPASKGGTQNTDFYLWDEKTPLVNIANMNVDYGGEELNPYGLYPISYAVKSNSTRIIVDDLYPDKAVYFLNGNRAYKEFRQGFTLESKDRVTNTTGTRKKIPAGDYRFVSFSKNEIFIGNRIKVVEGTTESKLSGLSISVPTEVISSLSSSHYYIIMGCDEKDNDLRLWYGNRDGLDSAFVQIMSLYGAKSLKKLRLVDAENPEIIYAYNNDDSYTDGENKQINLEKSEYEYAVSPGYAYMKAGGENVGGSTGEFCYVDPDSGRAYQPGAVLIKNKTYYTVPLNRTLQNENESIDWAKYNEDLNIYTGGDSSYPVINLPIFEDVEIKGQVNLDVNGEKSPAGNVQLIFTQGKRVTQVTTDGEGRYKAMLYGGMDAFVSAPLEVPSSIESRFIKLNGTAISEGEDYNPVITYRNIEPAIEIDTQMSDDNEYNAKLPLNPISVNIKKGDTYLTAIGEIRPNTLSRISLLPTDNDVAFDSLKEGDVLTLEWGDNQAFAGDSTTVSIDSAINGKTTVKLKSRGGVLAEVKSYEGAGYQYKAQWFDSESGEYLGTGDGCFISAAGNYSFACPYTLNDAKKFNVAIIMSSVEACNLDYNSFKKKYSDAAILAENISLKNGDFKTISGSLTLKGTQSVLYVTKPGSSLNAPETFSKDDSVIAVSGRIELDEDITAGNLKNLWISIKDTDGSTRGTATVRGLSIGGKYYANNGVIGSYVSGALTMMKSYPYYTFAPEKDQAIDLSKPCDFMVYVSPFSDDKDIHLQINVTADNNCDSEPVGDIVIRAPHPSISAEKFVGTDYVLAEVSGEGDKSIYDNDELVLTSDANGEIKIPLKGISSYEVSSHDILIRQGNKSDSMRVVYMPGYPTLTYFAMDDKKPGSSYTQMTGSSMEHKFEARFDNPENLKAIGDDYGLLNGVTVVFAAKKTDGTIDYIPGNRKETGVYTANKASKLAYVSVSVMYEGDWDKLNAAVADNKARVAAKSLSANNVDVTQTFISEEAELLEDYISIKNSSETQMASLEEMIAEYREDIVKAAKSKGVDISFTVNSSDEAASKKGADEIIKEAMSEESRKAVFDANPDKGYQLIVADRGISEELFKKDLGDGSGFVRNLVLNDNGDIVIEQYIKLYGVDEVNTTHTVAQLIIIADRSGSEVSYCERMLIGLFNDNFDFRLTEKAEINGDLAEEKTEIAEMTDEESLSETADVIDSTSKNSNGVINTVDNCTTVTGTALNVYGIYDGCSSMVKNPAGSWKGEFSTKGSVLGGIAVAGSIYSTIRGSQNNSEAYISCYKTSLSNCYYKLSANAKASMERELAALRKTKQTSDKFNFMSGVFGVATNAAGAAGVVGAPYSIIFSVAGMCADNINTDMQNNVKAEAQLWNELYDFWIMKESRTNSDLADCMENNRKRNYNPSLDPSGVVYEAVLSNPVAGAKVTIYTDGTNNSYRPVYNEAGELTSADSVHFDRLKLTDSIIPKTNTLTTGEDGRFSWFVPEGLWYVTAEKNRYNSGDSGADVQALIKGDNYNWLPVMPEQLNVNIPLVNYEPPKVSRVNYDQAGMTVIFSKYMDISSISADSFKVMIDSEPVKVEAISFIDKEAAPDNIRHEDGVPVYAKSVRLFVKIPDNMIATLTVDDSVCSYAGVSLALGSDAGKNILVANGESKTPKPTICDKHEFNKNGECVMCGTKKSDFCEHEFNETGICSKCGIKKSDICEHNFNETGICSKCGIKKSDICEHDFDENNVCRKCQYKRIDPGNEWLSSCKKISDTEYELNLAVKQKYVIDELAKEKADGKNYKITIDGDSKKLVSVNTKCCIAAKKTGKAVVHLLKGGVEYTLTINISDPQFIYENPKVKYFSVNVGEKITPLYNNYGLKPEFSVQKNCKAGTVDAATGEVTAVKKGNITLMAIVGSGKQSRMVKTKVKVYDPIIQSSKSVSYSEDKREGEVYINKGKSLKLNVKNGIKNSSYVCSDTTVISIDSKGKLTALKEGESVVTVINNGRSMKLNVIVRIANY